MKLPSNRRILLWGAVACAALFTTRPARADYPSTVTGFGPLAYYRLNDTGSVPIPDIATNLGTLGARFNGFYQGDIQHPFAPGALVGEPNDNCVNCPGGGGKVGVGYDPLINPTGPFSAEVWANPTAISGSQYPLGPLSSLYYDANVASAARAGWLIYQNSGDWMFRMGDTAGYTAMTEGGMATVTTWHHIVGVYDGTNATLYVNGVSVSSVALSRPFVGNPKQPLEIGTASPFGRSFNGLVDEVAIYTNALTAAEVLAHYQNGISAHPSQPYAQLVLAKKPILYFRLDEPTYTPPDTSTLPVAVNTGSLGTAINGTYQPGSATAAAGPPGSGFGTGNTAASFDGFDGSVLLGNPDGLNFTNQITVMAWIQPTSTTALRDILAHGYISSPNQEVFFRINAGSYEIGDYASGVTASAGGVANQDVGNWVFLAGTFDGSKWNLYRYGELIASAASTAGAGQVDSSWSIGSRGDPTLGDSRNFAGRIDEVAIFNKGLTQDQIRQIFYAAQTAPVIIQQPQAPLGTIIAGAPVSISTVAVGPPTLGYQWTKEGVNLSGKTNATLAFSNITTNDAGNYAVIVTNLYGSVTSSVATLTVTYPTAPAAILHVVGYPAWDSTAQQASLTQVLLEFSGPLSQAGGNPANYTISDGQHTLTVSAASFSNNNLNVALTTSAQTPGQAYTVTLTGITDGVGNPLANNSAPFTAWVTSPANGLYWEYYPNIEGTVVAALTGDSVFFPDFPNATTNLTVFDTRAVFPDDTHDNYGTRISGLFVPPVSGNWVFFARSDDSSQLFLNPNGPDAAGMTLIAQEAGCCEDWNMIYSAALPLIAGQGYYIETLHKEGGGGDYVKVAARLDGTGSPTLGTPNTVIDPASLAGPAVCYPYAPADVGGPILLTGPSSLSVAANHPVTLSATASNPAGLSMFYQRYRNGAAIAGATTTFYSFIAASSDNNAQFTVKVSKVGSVATSPAATLTVTADTTPPAVVVIHGSKAMNTLTVGFSERMQANPSAAAFTIPGFTVTSAVLDSTGTNVVLTLDKPMTSGQTFTLTVQGVQDSAGNTLASATAPGEAFLFSRGFLKWDFFGGLSTSDTSMSLLTSDPRYPDSPDFTSFVIGLDSRSIFPNDNHCGYGDHITGLFVPPATGNYYFYIRSDDWSQLYLNSAGTDPLGSTIQAEETGCCEGFSAHSNTNLGAVPLIGGQQYDIETLHREGGGGDYVQAAFKLDTDPGSPDALPPIPPAYVGLMADPLGASVTITQQPASIATAYLAGDPKTVLDINFSAGDGGFTVTNYGNPVGPWSYAAVSGSWTNHGPAASLGYPGPFASGLHSTVIHITNAAPVVLSFTHRHSFELSDKAYDGGQVRLSVNGGAFGTVPSLNFFQNGYEGAIQGTVYPNLTTTPGWTNAGFIGDSPGYSTGAMITSLARLGSFNVGDTLQLEFLASWDEGAEGTEPNWEISALQVTVGAAPPVTVSFTVGAESTYQFQPNQIMSYFWQENTGSGFADVVGAYSPTYTFNASLADSGTDYRCIVYSPGASATSSVASLTVALPITFGLTDANTLKLVWPLPPAPLTVASYALEQTPSLSPPAWVTSTATLQTTTTTVFTTVPLVHTGPGMLYRLHKK